MAQTKNLTLYAGDTFDMTFCLKQKGTGLPVDLTGCVPKAQVRTSAQDSTVMAEIDADIMVQSGAGIGKVILHLTPTQTATMTNGVWDVQLTWPDGSIKTYLNGSVTIIPEVTRGP
jgi:hypothetical protein